MEKPIPLPYSEVGAGYTVLQPSETYIQPEGNAIDVLLREAENRSNALRHAIRTEDTPYGQHYAEIMEDPRLDHHNSFHARHVEKFAKKSLQEFISFYSQEGSPLDVSMFTSQEAMTDLSAFALFPYFHDLTQLEYAAHNLDIEDKSQKVNEKNGHGIGAAIQKRVFAEKYAEVNGITLEEAREVTGVAGTMDIRHDQPKFFDKTFGEAKRYRGEEVRALRGKELLEAYERDEIYVYDLSTAQLIDIFRQIRKVDEGYGFTPEFEETYARELAALEVDEEPLVPNMTPEREERLRHLTEINYSADMKDMISPYVEQITRTLNTQYSKNRPFSMFQGDISANSIALDEAMTHIMGENGTLNSDDVRFLWEMVHINGISERSLVKHVPWEKEFLKEHIVMSALLLRDLGARVMRGDYSVIENVYNERLNVLGKRLFALESRLGEQGGDQHVNGGLTKKIEGIVAERDAVIDSLRNKHENYAPQDIHMFQELVDRVLGELTSMYDVSEDDYIGYQIKVDEFIKAETLFFESDPVVENPYNVTETSIPYFEKVTAHK